MEKNVESGGKCLNRTLLILTISIACFIGLASVYLQNQLVSSSSNSALGVQSKTLKYWPIVVNDWHAQGSLRTMNRVFDRLGYEVVNGSEGEDWDVLWTLDYPFKIIINDVFVTPEIYKNVGKQLKPHQLVNHIPGINFITHKYFMNTNNQDLPYILKSFEFPDMIEDFKMFLKKNPGRKIVHKNLTNRGIRVINLTDVDYDTNFKFYQEFMDKPFLIDGRVFDLGVFVLISSINPLRIYRYDQEVLMRFCPEPYYPFDPLNIDKYVIYENHDHFCDLPSFESYCDTYGYSWKTILKHHFDQEGHDFEKLQQEIDAAIVELTLKHEKNFVEDTSELFNSTRNFFELVRFDFVLDENLKLYLMEVNMSPNLTPMFERFEKNAHTNEQLVHKTLTLVGAGSHADLMSGYDTKSNEMQSSSKNIAVDPGTCINNNCVENCDKTECKLCQPCLSSEDSINLHRAYREHMRKGDFKRVFPSENHFKEDFVSSLTPANQIMTKWFEAKCRENSNWC